MSTPNQQTPDSYLERKWGRALIVFGIFAAVTVALFVTWATRHHAPSDSSTTATAAHSEATSSFTDAPTPASEPTLKISTTGPTATTTKTDSKSVTGESPMTTVYVGKFKNTDGTEYLVNISGDSLTVYEHYTNGKADGIGSGFDPAQLTYENDGAAYELCPATGNYPESCVKAVGALHGNDVRMPSFAPMDSAPSTPANS